MRSIDTSDRGGGGSKLQQTDGLQELFDAVHRDPVARTAFAEREADLKLARFVREMRKNARLTQQGLAELVGTHQPNIARLESGEGTNMTIEMLTRVADACKVHVVLGWTTTDQVKEVVEHSAPDVHLIAM